MSALSNPELTNYMQKVCQHEYAIYQIDQINQHIRSLQRSAPAMPDKKAVKKDLIIVVFFRMLFKLLIPSAIILFVWSLINKESLNSVLEWFRGLPVLKQIYDYLLSDNPVTLWIAAFSESHETLGFLLFLLYTLLIIILPIVLILTVILWLRGVAHHASSKHEAKTSIKQYNNQKEVIDKYNLMLRYQIGKNEREKESWKASLDRLYDMDVLKPRYRNLTDVFTIYEYLDDGICTSLEGEHGAYLRCREEQRAQRLESVLKEGFDRLYAGQARLAAAMAENNQRIQQMESSFNSRITALTNEVSKTNANLSIANSTLGGIKKELGDISDYYRHTASDTLSSVKKDMGDIANYYRHRDD